MRISLYMQFRRTISGYVRGRRPDLMHSWGRLMARWRWMVLCVWAIAIVLGATAFGAVEDRQSAIDLAVPASDSVRANEVLAERIPEMGTEQVVMVFRAARLTVDDERYRRIIDRSTQAASEVSGVRSVTSPFDSFSRSMISKDRRVSAAVVAVGGDMAARASVARAVEESVGAEGDVSVAVTGYSALQNAATEVQNRDAQRAEMIGLPVALVVLVLALGVGVGAVVPIVVALVGLLSAMSILFVLSYAMDFDALSVSVMTMIGVGVGIDYAMFIVSRFREELAVAAPRRDRRTIDSAVSRSLATAGRTIVASGIIVTISLLALIVIRAPVFRGVAIGVAVAVAVMLLVATTLLPAVLSALGPRFGFGRSPRRGPADDAADHQSSAQDSEQNRWWARWAYHVMRRPVVYAAAVTAILLIAAAPLSGVRYGLDMGTEGLAGTGSGQAAATMLESFPAGAMSPVNIVATGSDGKELDAADRTRVNRLFTEIATNADVAAVVPVTAEGVLAATIILQSSFDSGAAVDTVGEIRRVATAAAPAQVLVGGSTAEFIDLGTEMRAKLPWVVALVLASSLVFLVASFRSIVLPLKAIAMNLLVTLAALGLTIVVFQWGLGEDVLGFESPGFVQLYLPTLVFAVLFGLSMDYEVFLVGRMREYWLATGSNERAVAAGLAHTGRPITAAAAIMVVVFGSFVTATTLELKQIGFALSIAIALDAILVRMVLVPALMRTFGRWNWWLPGASAPPPPVRPRVSPRRSHS